MTPLAVVAYPRLDDGDRVWIEAFRARHDPWSARVAAHFTLVFPTAAAAAAVAVEIESIVRTTPRIDFAVRRSAVARDRVGGGFHVLLLPDEGAAEIAALHDRLYAGTLRASLRGDIPYLPHVTLGAALDELAAQQLAAELGPVRVMRGTIAAIDLLQVRPSAVQSLQTYALRAGAAPRAR